MDELSRADNSMTVATEPQFNYLPIQTGLERPLRVLILDNFVGNMGDAAIALAMQQSFKETFGAETQVHFCFCGVGSDPGIFAQLYPEIHFVSTLWNAIGDWITAQRNPWLRLLRKTSAQRFVRQAKLHSRGLPGQLLFGPERALFAEYVHADLIVITGGAALCTSWTIPRLRRPRAAQYAAALTLGKPLVFYAQSVGPFTSEDTLPDLLRDPMQRADAVLCRDAESVRIVREKVGVETDNVHLTIDEVLLMSPCVPDIPLLPPQQRPLRIGICVHKWHWLGHTDPEAKQREFEARMVAVSRQLLERGDVELVYVTTHQKFDGAIVSDEDVSERIQQQLPAELLPLTHRIRGFVHPQIFAHVMGECDLVITSRLHGGILSLVGGAPIVALSYEPKTLGLMEQIGLTDWTLSMWDSSAEEIYAQAKKMLDDLPGVEEKLRVAMAEARRLALQNRTIVAKVMSARLQRSTLK